MAFEVYARYDFYQALVKKSMLEITVYGNLENVSRV